MEFKSIKSIVDNLPIDKTIEKIDSELNKSCLDKEAVHSYEILKARALKELGKYSEGLILLEKYSTSDFDYSLYVKFNFLVVRSWLLFREGDTESGFQDASKAKIIADDSNLFLSTLEYSNLHYLLALLHIDKLELDGALHYLDESLSYINEEDKKMEYSRILNAIGIVYFHKGELDTCINYYYQSLVINREIGNKIQEGISYNNMGYTYYLYGDFEKSKDYLLQAKNLFQKEKFDYYLATSLFNLFRTLYAINDISVANQYLEKLKVIASKSENINNDRIQCSYKLCKGIHLMNGSKLSNLIEAEEVFKNVIEDNLETQFIIIAMIHLAEILLIELRVNKEKSIYQEIFDLMSKLHYYAEKQGLHTIKISIFILEAKVHIIQDNYEKAFETYQKAKKLASDKDLEIFKNKINDELDDLRDQVIRMKEIINVNSSIAEKIKESKIHDYLKDIRKMI